jgi:hypothetical protein
MAQDGTTYGNQQTRVLRMPSLPSTPTGEQADLVAKLRNLDGNNFADRAFKRFNLTNIAVGSEFRVTMEVDPYFRNLFEFKNFLRSSRVPHNGATSLQDDSLGTIYKQFVNNVYMMFYRNGQSPY